MTYISKIIIEELSTQKNYAYKSKSTKYLCKLIKTVKFTFTIIHKLYFHTTWSEYLKVLDLLDKIKRYIFDVLKL